MTPTADSVDKRRWCWLQATNELAHGTVSNGSHQIHLKTEADRHKGIKPKQKWKTAPRSCSGSHSAFHLWVDLLQTAAYFALPYTAYKCKPEYVTKHKCILSHFLLCCRSVFFYADKDNPVAQGQAWGQPLNLSIPSDGSSRCRVASNCYAETHALTIKTKLLGNDAWPVLK